MEGEYVTYRPLPDFLYVSRSEIEGHGLFTSKPIKAGVVLGITHVKDERFENDYIRTPLGGFFNHSQDPNCEAFVEGDYILLKTIKEIKQGEELTAFYWLYDLNQEENTV